VSLTKVYIWNYTVQDATDVGMKEVEVQVSSDTDMATARFNAIARISLAEGGDKAQVYDVIGTNVRLVRLKGLSNWGQGYTVGLAEVRFGTGESPVTCPSSIISPLEGAEIAFGTDILIDTTVTDWTVHQCAEGRFTAGTRSDQPDGEPVRFVYKGATNGARSTRW
jgi:hypothetical protein